MSHHHPVREKQTAVIALEFFFRLHFALGFGAATVVAARVTETTMREQVISNLLKANSQVPGPRPFRPRL